jgi:hypothetical protein
VGEDRLVEEFVIMTDSQEVNVAGTVRNRPRPHILNSDGQPHPVENIMTVFTVLVGLASFVLGLIARNVPTSGAAVHISATTTGLISLLVGLYAQMVSATRPQRVLIVTGMIAGFVGLAIGLSRGGFVG